MRKASSDLGYDAQQSAEGPHRVSDVEPWSMLADADEWSGITPPNDQPEVSHAWSGPVRNLIDMFHPIAPDYRPSGPPSNHSRQIAMPSTRPLRAEAYSNVAEASNADDQHHQRSPWSGEAAVGEKFANRRQRQQRQHSNVPDHTSDDNTTRKNDLSRGSSPKYNDDTVDEAELPSSTRSKLNSPTTSKNMKSHVNGTLKSASRSSRPVTPAASRAHIPVPPQHADLDDSQPESVTKSDDDDDDVLDDFPQQKQQQLQNYNELGARAKTSLNENRSASIAGAAGGVPTTDTCSRTPQSDFHLGPGRNASPAGDRMLEYEESVGEGRVESAFGVHHMSNGVGEWEAELEYDIDMDHESHDAAPTQVQRRTPAPRSVIGSRTVRPAASATTAASVRTSPQHSKPLRRRQQIDQQYATAADNRTAHALPLPSLNTHQLHQGDGPDKKATTLYDSDNGPDAHQRMPLSQHRKKTVHLTTKELDAELDRVLTLMERQKDADDRTFFEDGVSTCHSSVDGDEKISLFPVPNRQPMKTSQRYAGSGDHRTASVMTSPQHSKLPRRRQQMDLQYATAADYRTAHALPLPSLNTHQLLQSDGSDRKTTKPYDSVNGPDANAHQRSRMPTPDHHRKKPVHTTTKELDAELDRILAMMKQQEDTDDIQFFEDGTNICQSNAVGDKRISIIPVPFQQPMKTSQRFAGSGDYRIKLKRTPSNQSSRSPTRNKSHHRKSATHCRSSGSSRYARYPDQYLPFQMLPYPHPQQVYPYWQHYDDQPKQITQQNQYNPFSQHQQLHRHPEHEERPTLGPASRYAKYYEQKRRKVPLVVGSNNNHTIRSLVSPRSTILMTWKMTRIVVMILFSSAGELSAAVYERLQSIQNIHLPRALQQANHVPALVHAVSRLLSLFYWITDDWVMFVLVVGALCCLYFLINNFIFVLGTL